jgi:hypothetical protein
MYGNEMGTGKFGAASIDKKDSPVVLEIFAPYLNLNILVC